MTRKKSEAKNQTPYCLCTGPCNSNCQHDNVFLQNEANGYIRLIPKLRDEWVPRYMNSQEVSMLPFGHFRRVLLGLHSGEGVHPNELDQALDNFLLKKKEKDSSSHAAVSFLTTLVNDPFRLVSDWPAKPIEDNVAEYFIGCLALRKRFTMIFNDANWIPDLSTGIKLVSETKMTVKKLPEGTIRSDLVILNGKYHSAVFSIYELSMPHAIELVVEEFADEKMTWSEAMYLIADRRKALYKKLAREGAPIPKVYLKNDPKKLMLIRIQEYLELSSFDLSGDDHGDFSDYDDDDDDDYDSPRNPPRNTNLEYFGIKGAKDLRKVIKSEFKFVAEYCTIEFMEKYAPWFFERGHCMDYVKFMNDVIEWKSDKMRKTGHQDSEMEFLANIFETLSLPQRQKLNELARMPSSSDEFTEFLMGDHSDDKDSQSILNLMHFVRQVVTTPDEWMEEGMEIVLECYEEALRMEGLWETYNWRQSRKPVPIQVGMRPRFFPSRQ